jgi:hypothetical protein
MASKHLFLSLSIVALFSAFRFFTPTADIIEEILAKLNHYMRQSPREKVYLHLDKPYYMAGDTLWYKAYLFDAQAHGIDSVSRVLYVDLIDPTGGKILSHQVLKCTSGMSDGAINLPDSLKEGIYGIRAYTQFMRNYGDDWFFNQSIKVWQGSVKHRVEDANLAQVADFQFFPEGGYLVNDMVSRVAFKAVNSLGKGVNISGVLLENETDTVIGFQSVNHGMGYFQFSAKTGKSYSVKIKTADGTVSTYPLNDIQQNGYGLQVDNLSSRQNIRLIVTNASGKPMEQRSGNLYLVAHQRGVACFSVKIPEAKTTMVVNLPRINIPADGLVLITLFDAQGKPRCERLIFVQKTPPVNLAIQTNKSLYKPREKVALTIQAHDSTGKPVVGNFSLAVTDGKQVVSEGYEENLMTYLLMSSDLNGKDAILRGGIEDPAYYFDKTSKTATRDLDILMMTQGWRRFLWDDILKEQFVPLNFPIEQSLTVVGKTLRPNGKVSNNVTMTLMMSPKNQKTKLAMSFTDSTGGFVFNGLDFTDSVHIFIQAVKEKGGRNLDITIDPTTSPTVEMTRIPFNTLRFDAKVFAEFLKTAAEKLAFEKRLRESQDKLLAEVEVKAKKTEKIDNRRIYNKPSSSLDVSDIDCGSYATVLDMIQGKVAGVLINRNGFEYAVQIRGGSSVGYYLDGMPVDLDFITSLSVCDIETVDILKGPEASIFGLNGGDGVISVLSRRANPNYDWSNAAAPGVVIVKKQGYEPKRQFYMPRYDSAVPEHEFADRRSTLYWQPYVQTDESGKATVYFWNSDAECPINISLQGVAKTGHVAVARFQYEVKK